MKRVLFILALICIPFTANAEQTLPVRAGEHGDYSRLVIPNAPSDWRIATSNRKIEIAFDNKDFAFDLSDIMGKRKAHRVLSADVIDGADARALVLSLTCDCTVRTSKSAQNSIIIDIYNDSPTVTAPIQTTAANQPPTTTTQEVQRTPATAENIRVARDRMIALLAEARHQGVVQLKIDEERAQKQADHPQAHPATPAAHTPAAEPSPLPGAPRVNEHPVAHPEKLAADAPPTNLVDDADHAGAKATPTLIETAECVDPSLFAAPSAQDGALDYAAITNLRQLQEQTEDEDEKSDIAKTLALAYMHIGFFEEASAIASSRADEDGNMAIASALANLASGKTSVARTTLAPYQQCGAFFEMIHAAASRPHESDLAPLKDKHIVALKSLTAPLRAPIAEQLALFALERDEKAIAQAAYKVALEASGGETTAALAILEREFADAPKKIAAAEQKLVEVAQTPGPLQAKALSVLAEEYSERAETAYEGFLDDLAAQTSRRNTNPDDARAAFSGAKALASAGRLQQGVSVLEAATRNAPGAKPAGQALARSIILSALSGDDESRLNAVDAFFKFQDFVVDPENGDLNIAVAHELAAFGASDLVDLALTETPADWRAQGVAEKARALLNAGEARGALDLSRSNPANTDLLTVSVLAYENLGDQDGVAETVKTAIRKNTANDAMTRAAWRAARHNDNWALTVAAFNAVAPEARTEGAAKRASLAALNNGATTMPAPAREALSQQPELLSALSHMFVTAPRVNLRAVGVLADFSQGVAKETVFMKKGVGDE